MQMSRKQVIILAVVLIAVVAFTPYEVMAKKMDGDHFKEVIAQADTISNFLLGKALSFTGAVGIFYGIVRAVFTSTMAPIWTFGGIGLGAVVAPKFMDGVVALQGILIQ
jgi:hypothetical protein